MATITKTKKTETKKNALLDHGVSMIREQGYYGTGLQEILDSVNIPKGSFYNYFSSKENFGAEVIQHYIEPYITKLTTHLHQSEGDALGALNKYYKELVAEIVNAKFKGGCLLGNLMGEIGDTSEVCNKSLKSAVTRYRDLIQLCLEQAQQQGSVRTDKSARDMADLLVNTWQGALLRTKIEKSSRPVKQCCQDLLENYFMP